MADDKEPHGNSKNSKKNQHVYKIVDSNINDVAKFGVSGSPLNKDGTSPRANAQVNYLNKIAGYLKYYAVVIYTKIKGRIKGLEIEQDLVNDFADKHEDQLPKAQKRPKPKPKNDTNENE